MARNSGSYIQDDQAYQAAIARRIKENARKGRTARWLAEDPTRGELIQKIVEVLNMGRANDFICKMYDNYLEWGSLTVNQEAAIRRGFEKREEIKKERIEASRGSDFVGSEGVRTTFTLTLTKVFETDTPFGLAFVHKFKDENDNLVTWKATKRLDMAEGDTKKITATVKHHYVNKDGIKTTYINRAKVA